MTPRARPSVRSSRTRSSSQSCGSAAPADWAMSSSTSTDAMSWPSSKSAQRNATATRSPTSRPDGVGAGGQRQRRHRRRWESRRVEPGEQVGSDLRPQGLDLLRDEIRIERLLVHDLERPRADLQREIGAACRSLLDDPAQPHVREWAAHIGEHLDRLQPRVAPTDRARPDTRSHDTTEPRVARTTADPKVPLPHAPNVIGRCRVNERPSSRRNGDLRLDRLVRSLPSRAGKGPSALPHRQRESYVQSRRWSMW